jgi:LL-diaminopimelate aminotransferase
MIHINENYLKLQASYLFSEIARKVTEFQTANPAGDIIKLGIGDVTRPLPQACTKAFHAAIDDQSVAGSFHGYGPEQGYQFLREHISEYEYKKFNTDIEADEIFVSDGSKCDSGNFQELFSQDTRIAVPDPVYPVYVDTNVMAGRTVKFENGRYQGLVYLEATEDNGFVPAPPAENVDVIYLCFPNNPTGATATREQLTRWVEYAIDKQALILYDAAYVSYIKDKKIPRSIFEIPGARRVAVEFRSFSKTAGFTGTRCAFTAIPKECLGYDRDGNTHSIHSLWNRRQSTKFNGASYPVQKAASAVYTPEGQKEVQDLVDFYLGNAKLILATLTDLGYSCTGGINSPYIWVKTETDSWEFFDRLLMEAGVVITPGSGFGKCGEGYIRISAFNERDKVETAMERISIALRS